MMKKICKFILLTLLAVFLSLPQAQAEPVVEIETLYYTVTGNTANKIRRNLNKVTPVIVGNKRFDAYTRWNVSWKYRYRIEQNRCSMTEVSLNTTINHTMPKLTTTLSPKLSQKWQNYYKALLDHEKGHADLGIKAAIEIEKAINDLPPQNSCSALETMANGLGQAVIQQYIELEKEYDRDTQHGATKGVVFP